MENNKFKSVAFGGFDKQDVIQYIEQAAKDAAAVQDQLRQENDALKAENSRLTEQVEQLTAKTQSQESSVAQLWDEAQSAAILREEVETLQAETAALREQVERFRTDAEAYAKFRDRVGDIECESHKRAAELEETTVARLQQVVEAFQTRYTELMRTFDATAVHVTGELRKVEVSLTQLPRAMDPSGAELKELRAVLDRAAPKQKKSAT